MRSVVFVHKDVLPGARLPGDRGRRHTNVTANHAHQPGREDAHPIVAKHAEGGRQHVVAVDDRAEAELIFARRFHPHHRGKLAPDSVAEQGWRLGLAANEAHQQAEKHTLCHVGRGRRSRTN